MNLSEALTTYLSSSARKLDAYAHEELNRFGRTVGLSKNVEGLAPPDVATYAEGVVAAGGDVHGRLGPVKEFLTFLKKKGLSGHSLSAHVKIPRASIRAAAAASLAFETIDMTEDGLASAKQELATLKAGRNDIVEAIRIAAADKDFRENAPLDAAREDQGKAEARIRELEETIRRAVVIDRTAQANGARVGSTLVLRDPDREKDVTYTLVDSMEADPGSGKISIASPVGSAVVGKSEGQEVDVKTPKGSRRYLIRSVKF